MKKHNVIIFLVPFIFLLCVQDLLSGEVPSNEKIFKEINNNISSEYVSCSAFYDLRAEALSRSGDAEAAENMKEIQHAAFIAALIAARAGSTQETAHTATISRLKSELHSMNEEIENDLGNISRLFNKYALLCKEVMEDSDKMTAKWSAKVFKKYNLGE